MGSDKLRRRVAWEAARMVYTREESEYRRAKLKAGRRIAGGDLKAGDLPTNREIRDEVQVMARASAARFEQFLTRVHPDPSLDLPLDHEAPEARSKLDRFQVYRRLLLPLENVKENLVHHPEGDALYHSLQVFDLGRDELPYDEEFLLAALLHDVGKAIDPGSTVPATLEALEGYVTARTAWLIEHHMEARAWYERTLGVRSRRRLEASEDWEELKLLATCDQAGRQRGVAAPDVDDALDYVRELARTCGE